ncbi:hypothetical protein C8K36_108143 [Rhodococcus sp. OK519]|nr:hypothetical protein C8K36_108143 [Rhodococcus sp. OK519]
MLVGLTSELRKYPRGRDMDGSAQGQTPVGGPSRSINQLRDLCCYVTSDESEVITPISWPSE